MLSFLIHPCPSRCSEEFPHQFGTWWVSLGLAFLRGSWCRDASRSVDRRFRGNVMTQLWLHEGLQVLGSGCCYDIVKNQRYLSLRLCPQTMHGHLGRTCGQHSTDVLLSSKWTVQHPVHLAGQNLLDFHHHIECAAKILSDATRAAIRSDSTSSFFLLVSWYLVSCT